MDTKVREKKSNIIWDAKITQIKTMYLYVERDTIQIYT